MTSPRRETVDRSQSGFYHCTSRCVRRAFLCGRDSYSRKSYEHRREWIRTRLCELLEIFAIECIAYAVMSNHLHSLLRNRPDLVATWSDEEVARRWRTLFPYRRNKFGQPEEPTPAELFAITCQPGVVAEYRNRLSDLSWFNRCMNENIARRANAEDECKGRFWEGRFKCQRLEGLAALVACSVYVDLNPIRAGMALTPEGSDFTSVQDRVRVMVSPTLHTAVRPRLLSIQEVTGGDLTEQEYLKLVDETGRTLAAGKQSISEELLPILERLGVQPRGWVVNASSQGRLFRRIIAPIDKLKEFAAAKGRCWFQGMAAARKVFA